MVAGIRPRADDRRRPAPRPDASRPRDAPAGPVGLGVPDLLVGQGGPAASRVPGPGRAGDLTAQKRKIVREPCCDRRSVASPSEFLGIPAGTVEARAYDALRALQPALAARGVLAPDAVGAGDAPSQALGAGSGSA
ncbi:hypothetical protein AB0M97_16170 [Streptomyces sp. NPDC051207]|uniref:hypothetical protein n=1 Tax=Streptomyces sp. NPDC051207 TaxID=3154641 RepID=UPI00343947AF